MAEVIHIREFLRQRGIAQNRARDRESLGRAIEILKQNLHAVAFELLEASPSEQPELIDRAGRLVAMIQYGLRMLGAPPETNLPAGGAGQA
jgi:hypothetical protein